MPVLSNMFENNFLARMLNFVTNTANSFLSEPIWIQEGTNYSIGAVVNFIYIKLKRD